MNAVLDASFFFGDFPAEGDIFTVPSVIDELKDIRAKGNFEKWCARGLRVQSPTEESRKRVISAARATKDVTVISGTDRDLLALALDLGADLYTDDFAIQNVALVLGVKTSRSSSGRPGGFTGSTGAAAVAGTRTMTGNARSAVPPLKENLNRYRRIFSPCLPLTI